MNMVSRTSHSDSSIHQIFYTPLQHSLSHASSDSGDLTPPPPLTTGNGNPNHLGENENLGFQIDECDKNLGGSVIRDYEREGLGCKFDENRVLECNIVLKIGASEANLYIDGDQTQRTNTNGLHLDSEEYGKKVGCNKQRRSISLDSKVADSISEGRILVRIWRHGDDDRERENLCVNGVERDGINKSEIGPIGVGDNLQRKGLTCEQVKRKVNKYVQGGYGNDKGEMLCTNCKGVIGVSRGEKLCETGKRGAGVSEGENMRKNVRRHNAVIGGEELCKNGEEGDTFRKDNLSKSRNGDGEVHEVENLRGNGVRGLHEAIKVNEEFKFVNSSNGMDGRGKESGALGKRKLPLSMMGQGKDVCGEVKCGNMAGFLVDLLEASKFLIREVDDDGLENDFLETAKKKGMVFPQMRWCPPE